MEVIFTDLDLEPSGPILCNAKYMSLHFSYKLAERRHGSEYDKLKIYGFDFPTDPDPSIFIIDLQDASKKLI